MSVEGETGDFAGGEFDARSRKVNTRLDREGVAAEKALRLKNTRTGHVSQLTKLYNECAALMEDRSNLEIVKSKRDAVNNAFKRFQRSHYDYHICLHDNSECQLEKEKAYDEQCQRKYEMLTKLNSWIDDSAEKVRDENRRKKQPGDSISNIGSNQGSALSSASEVRRAKAKQGVARLRMEQLKRRQELLRQEEEMRRKLEMSEAQNKVEQADLEAKIYSEDDIAPPERVTDYEDHKPLKLNPNAPSWPERPEPDNYDHAAPSTEQALKTLAVTIRQGFALPKPELMKFDCNPLEYWSFIRSFDNNIERNASDETEKFSPTIFIASICAKL